MPPLSFSLKGLKIPPDPSHLLSVRFVAFCLCNNYCIRSQWTGITRNSCLDFIILAFPECAGQRLAQVKCFTLGGQAVDFTDWMKEREKQVDCYLFFISEKRWEGLMTILDQWAFLAWTPGWQAAGVPVPQLSSWQIWGVRSSFGDKDKWSEILLQIGRLPLLNFFNNLA